MDEIIVTGANGFIGHFVVDKLTAMGYHVHSIDRDIYKYDNPMVTSTAMDLSNCITVSDFIKNIDSVSTMVHLAADITVPGNSSTVGNNITGMLTSIEVAKKINVKYFIYLSSIPVIGDIKKTPITEEHPVHPRTMYHWSKYIGEKILEEHKDSFESITVVRIPSPIGAGMRKNVFLPLIMGRMMRGYDVEIYGEGKRVQNYIDVRDVAEALFLAVEKKPQGLYLISGKESISNMHLAELCKLVTHADVEIVSGKHIDNEESEKWIISSERARETFGFIPNYDLITTLQWIYEDMR